MKDIEINKISNEEIKAAFMTISKAIVKCSLVSERGKRESGELCINVKFSDDGISQQDNLRKIAEYISNKLETDSNRIK